MRISLLRFGAVFIFCLTIAISHIVPQHSDYIAAHGNAEIYAWGTGRPVAASDAYGPSRESSCGIFYFTHHPLLASYLGAVSIRLGLPGELPTQVGIAGSSALLIWLVAKYSHWGALNLFILIIGMLLGVPGYSEWLSHPIGHTWAFSMYFVAGIVALVGPWWGIPIISSVMAAFSIDAVVYHVAIIAGVTIARFGWSWTTLKVGIYSSLGYIGVNALHLIQVWCHFDWNFTDFWNNYFVDDGTHTSLSTRITHLPLSERMAQCWSLNAQYFMELFQNRHYKWTNPWGWPIIIWGATVPFLRFVNLRTLVAMVTFIVIFLSTAFLVPGLLAPHLHYLVRYVLLLPIGLNIINTVGYTARNRGAHD